MMVKRGQRFTLNGARWRVKYVTPSRAHCVSDVKRLVTVLDRKTGQPRTFEATSQRTIDISPNTPLDFLQEVAS